MVLIGVATRFASTWGQHTIANYQSVLDLILANNLNTIRIGSGDMFESPSDWNNGAAVQWFLDAVDHQENPCNLNVLVDRHHGIGQTSDNLDWTLIKNDLIADALRWESYGQRFKMEAINEWAPQGTVGGLTAEQRFRQKMQEFIDALRNYRDADHPDGLDTWLAFNDTGETNKSNSRFQLNDASFNRSLIGDHYYPYHSGNLWATGQTCYDRVVAIHNDSGGLPILNTEEGADAYELPYFKQASVNEIQTFFSLCAQAGHGCLLWLNQVIEDWTGKSGYNGYGYYNFQFPPTGNGNGNGGEVKLPFHDAFADLRNWTPISGAWTPK